MFTKNNEAIAEAIKSIGENPTYESVAELIPELIREQKLRLDLVGYTPHDDNTWSQKGVARYLVYDNPYPDNPFSIWIFAFGERQKTSIHDHIFQGTVTVLNGPVTEKLYEPVEGNPDKKLAIPYMRMDRHDFHCNRDNLEEHFVHQLKRRKAFGSGASVTLHIYKMPAYMEADIYRRNVENIFFKTGKEKDICPEYIQEKACNAIK